MDTSSVWKRIDGGEKTGAREAWTLLRAMIEDAHERGIDDLAAIDEAAITAVSALDRVDQRETERETLLFELRSERGRCRELDDVLVRMLDRDAEERISSLRSALDALDEIEIAVRVSESASVRPPEPAPPPTGELGEEERNRRVALVGCAVLVVAAISLLIYKIASEEGQRRNPAVVASVKGAVIEHLSPGMEGGSLRMEVDWARRLISASSYLGDPERALDWPDIYHDPKLETSVVWTPSREDRGTEFLEVAWNLEIDAKTVVVVEGPNAGAIIAIDEIVGVDQNKLGASDYVRLWSGRMEPSAGPRFTVVHLPEARPIKGVRVVLDTHIVKGVSSIDAIGLMRQKNQSR